MLAIHWFENSYMKLNKDKYDLIVLSYKHEKVCENIRKDLIRESNYVKLLGTAIDADLKFDKYFRKLCSKPNIRLTTVSVIEKLLSFTESRTRFETFVNSQFQYCATFWMFHSRRTNNKINRLPERTLIIVYDYDVSTFDQLLEMDISFCIHHRPEIQGSS